jgi:hypothetical protein
VAEAGRGASATTAVEPIHGLQMRSGHRVNKRMIRARSSSKAAAPSGGALRNESSLPLERCGVESGGFREYHRIFWRGAPEVTSRGAGLRSIPRK